MHRSPRAFGLAALVVLAGCTGVGLQPGDEPIELTVTPAPVPTDGTPTPAFRLAPGLSETRVANPLALASAHTDVLQGSVFHVRIEERVELPDGRTRWRVFEGTFANRTTYAFDVREGVDNETVIDSSLYANGDRLYQRLITDDGVGFYVPRERLDSRSTFPEDPVGSPRQFDELYVALAGARPAYDGTRTVDGETYHRVAASRPTREDFLAAWEYVDSFVSYRFEALVDDRGLVRSYRIEYVATRNGERRRVVRTARWWAVGNATAAPPDWYETARRRTAG